MGSFADLPDDIVGEVYSFLYPRYASRLTALLSGTCGCAKKENSDFKTTHQGAIAGYIMTPMWFTAGDRLFRHLRSELFGKAVAASDDLKLDEHGFQGSTLSEQRHSLPTNPRQFYPGILECLLDHTTTIDASLGPQDNEDAGSEDSYDSELANCGLFSSTRRKVTYRRKWTRMEGCFRHMEAATENGAAEVVKPARADRLDVPVDQKVPPWLTFRCVSSSWYEASEAYIALRQHQLYISNVKPTINCWRTLRAFRESSHPSNVGAHLVSGRPFPNGLLYDIARLEEPLHSPRLMDVAVFWLLHCNGDQSRMDTLFRDGLGDRVDHFWSYRRAWHPTDDEEDLVSETTHIVLSSEMHALPSRARAALIALRFAPVTPQYATIHDFHLLLQATGHVGITTKKGVHLPPTDDLEINAERKSSNSSFCVFGTASPLRALAEELTALVRPQIVLCENLDSFERRKATQHVEHLRRAVTISEWAIAAASTHARELVAEIWTTKVFEIARLHLASIVEKDFPLKGQHPDGYIQDMAPRYKLELRTVEKNFKGDTHHRVPMIPEYEEQKHPLGRAIHGIGSTKRSSFVALDNLIKFLVIRGDDVHGDGGSSGNGEGEPAATTVNNLLRALFLGEGITSERGLGGTAPVVVRAEQYRRIFESSPMPTPVAPAQLWSISLSSAEVFRFWINHSISVIAPLLTRFGHRDVLYERLFGPPSSPSSSSSASSCPSTASPPGYLTLLFGSTPTLLNESGVHVDPVASADKERASEASAVKIGSATSRCYQLGFTGCALRLHNAFFESNPSRSHFLKLWNWLVCEARVAEEEATDGEEKKWPWLAAHFQFIRGQVIVDLTFRRETMLLKNVLSMTTTAKCEDTNDLNVQAWVYPDAIAVERRLRTPLEHLGGGVGKEEGLDILTAICATVLQKDDVVTKYASSLNALGAKSGGTRWRNIFALFSSATNTSVLADIRKLVSASSSTKSRSKKRLLEDLELCFSISVSQESI